MPEDPKMEKPYVVLFGRNFFDIETWADFCRRMNAPISGCEAVALTERALHLNAEDLPRGINFLLYVGALRGKETISDEPSVPSWLTPFCRLDTCAANAFAPCAHKRIQRKAWEMLATLFESPRAALELHPGLAVNILEFLLRNGPCVETDPYLKPEIVLNFFRCVLALRPTEGDPAHAAYLKNVFPLLFLAAAQYDMIHRVFDPRILSLEEAEVAERALRTYHTRGTLGDLAADPTARDTQILAHIDANRLEHGIGDAACLLIAAQKILETRARREMRERGERLDGKIMA